MSRTLKMVTPTEGPGWIKKYEAVGLQWLRIRCAAGDRSVAVAVAIHALQEVFKGTYDAKQKTVEVPGTGRTTRACHERSIGGVADSVVVFWGYPPLLAKVETAFPDANILAVLWVPNHAKELARRGYQEHTES